VEGEEEEEVVMKVEVTVEGQLEVEVILGGRSTRRWYPKAMLRV
jgi:hypothetical protein